MPHNTFIGNSDWERTLLLRIMLIEFYQKHDPKLVRMPQGRDARKSKRGVEVLENLYEDAGKDYVPLPAISWIF